MMGTAMHPRSWPRPARAVGGAATLLVLWRVLATALERGAPPGILLRGAVVGGLYALGAIGIVLVWRGSGIVNFAQAELGSVAAVVAIELVVQYRLNYFAAVAIGLVLAALIGWLVEVSVVRRFRNAPRLILTVATIGVAQVLAGVAILVPLAWNGIGAGRFTTPFSAKFTLDPVVFDGNHVLVLIVVPAVLGALAWFLRSTDYGVGIRAAADNPDRANLLGLPTRGLSSLVWILAALLSAITVMLRVPLLGFASFANVSGGGNALLLRVLAAAVIGRMEHLPRTVMAAIGIGVFEELASSEWSNTNVVDGLLVVVILVALLVQRDAFRRASETGIGSWRAIREVRPIPPEMARLPEVRWGIRALQALVLVGVTTVPIWARPSQEEAVALLLVYAIVAVSLLVLTGWAGQISLGQFALVGFGGATTGILYERHGWDFLLALPVGMLVAAAAAVVIGIPALRVRGPFLAVTTLAFAVTTSTYFLNSTHFRWFVPGRVLPPVLWERIDLGTGWIRYEACAVGLLLAVVAARNLRASRTGRVLLAVRDNEAAASTMTISPTRAKLTAFAISGALAGLAGSLYAVLQRGIFADAFDAEVSVRLFSMVVIGGLSTIPGAILGAAYVRGADFFLPAQWALIASGAGILVLLMILPEGLGGGLYRIRDWVLRRIAKRRGLHVPSLLADARVGADPLPGVAAAPAVTDEADDADGADDELVGAG
jgi:branched-chain amino acid transport system permease protein